jgi:hypothetical protein
MNGSGGPKGAAFGIYWLWSDPNILVSRPGEYRLDVMQQKVAIGVHKSIPSCNPRGNGGLSCNPNSSQQLIKAIGTSRSGLVPLESVLNIKLSGGVPLLILPQSTHITEANEGSQ